MLNEWTLLRSLGSQDHPVDLGWVSTRVCVKLWRPIQDELALPEVPWVLCSPFRDKMVSGLAVVVARRSSRSGPASLLSLLPLGSFLGEPSWGAWSSHRHQGCGSPSFCITGMSTSGFTQCDRIAGSGPPRLTESLEQGSSPAFPTGHLQAMLPGPLIYG